MQKSKSITNKKTLSENQEVNISSHLVVVKQSGYLSTSYYVILIKCIKNYQY